MGKDGSKDNSEILLGEREQLALQILKVNVSLTGKKEQPSLYETLQKAQPRKQNRRRKGKRKRALFPLRSPHSPKTANKSPFSKRKQLPKPSSPITPPSQRDEEQPPAHARSPQERQHIQQDTPVRSEGLVKYNEKETNQVTLDPMTASLIAARRPRFFVFHDSNNTPDHISISNRKTRKRNASKASKRGRPWEDVKTTPPASPLQENQAESDAAIDEAWRKNLDSSWEKNIQKTKRELRQSQIRLQKNLESEKKHLPLEFLMQYNLRTYCHQQGSEKIINILVKGLTRMQRSAFKQWRTFCEWDRRQKQTRAATKIQSLVRGHIVRKQGIRKQKQRILAMEENKLIRNLTRLLEQRQEQGRNIQRVWRGYQGRQCARQERQDLKAVIRVQNHWRGKHCRLSFVVLKELQANKHRCATKIQSAFRGMKGRRRANERAIEVHTAKQELLLTDVEYLRNQRFIQTGAAVFIQKSFRKYLFRQQVRFHGHDIALQMQRIVRGFLGRVATRKQRKLVAYRKWVVSNRFVMEQNARKIQCAYRAKQSRRLLSKLIHERDETKRQRLLEKADKLNQKRKKGRLANMMVSRSRKRKAATRIQKFWRGRLAKRLIIHHRRKVKKERNFRAAAKIQATFRAYCVRRTYKEWRAGRAATRIQAVWRGHAVRALQNQRNLRLHAATKIQAQSRGFLARKSFLTRRLRFRSAVTIQTCYRGYSARSFFRFSMLDDLRARKELDILGAQQLQKALTNEQDRLLLASVYCDPRTADESSSEVLAFFHQMAQRVASPQPKKQRPGSPIKYEPLTVGTAAFSKFCRDVGIIEPDKSTQSAKNKKTKKPQPTSLAGATYLSLTKVDIIFSKCCMGKKKMDYLGFVDSIELIAQELFPGQEQYRLLRGADALILRLVDTYIIKGNLKRSLQVRTLDRATAMSRRIQGMYRCWKSRQVAKMARIAREYQLLLEKQLRAATAIQLKWRGFKARESFFLTIRSNYRCYVDTESGLKFWQNPVSGTTTWTKPSILGSHDVDAVIHLPPPRHQLIETCSRCEEATISAHCEECADSYCKSCCEIVHKKGKRAEHDIVLIDRCKNCGFQLASRSCLECGDIPLCDTCADFSHRAGTKLHHTLQWILDDLDICELCTVRAARYDAPGPVCSTCMEQTYQIDLSTVEPRAFVTARMRAHWADLQEKRMRKFLLDQAQEKEEFRKQKERKAAATRIQAVARGWFVRNGSSGQQVKHALQARLERIRKAKEEAEQKKLINRLKVNINQIKKVKAVTEEAGTKLLQKAKAKQRNTVASSEEQTLENPEQPPVKSKALFAKLSMNIGKFQGLKRKSEDTKNLDQGINVEQEKNTPQEPEDAKNLDQGANVEQENNPAQSVDGPQSEPESHASKTNEVASNEKVPQPSPTEHDDMPNESHEVTKNEKVSHETPTERVDFETAPVETPSFTTKTTRASFKTEKAAASFDQPAPEAVHEDQHEIKADPYPQVLEEPGIQFHQPYQQEADYSQTIFAPPALEYEETAPEYTHDEVYPHDATAAQQYSQEMHGQEYYPQEEAQDFAFAQEEMQQVEYQYSVHEYEQSYPQVYEQTYAQGYEQSQPYEQSYYNTENGYGTQVDMSQYQDVQAYDAQIEGDEGEEPDEWLEYFDETQQASYYYNPKRRESTWVNPFLTSAELLVDTTYMGEGYDEPQAEAHWTGQEAAMPQSYEEPFAFMQEPQQNPWIEYIDGVSGVPYYYNTETGETQWEKPAFFIN